MTTNKSKESSSGPVEALDGHIQSSFSEISIISSKGFNTIYRAKRYGQWYVLKGLSASSQNNPIYMGLLEKEFSLSVQFNHANIAHTYSFENVEGIGWCIVMEYIDGTTLDEYLNTSPSKTERLRITGQILSAMEYYHSLQVVHRDLKPKNILITRNGCNVKIIDFGLSDSDSYAIFKQPAGSAKYMAPEQSESGVKIDQRADIFSMGVIMKELLPSGYNQVIKQCVKENRSDRYSTATDLKKAIASVSQRRNTLIRTTAAIGIVAAIIAANVFFIKNLTHNGEPQIVHHVDTVIKEIVTNNVPTNKETVTVEKIVPLRIDTIVKIKEVVPPEYEALIKKGKDEQQRKERVKAETEKMYKFIDQECAKYAKDKESGRPEYLFQPGFMAETKRIEIVLQLLDKAIELRFTQEEYLRVINYSSSQFSKFIGEHKVPSTAEEIKLMNSIRDSLLTVMEKQKEISNQKMLIFQSLQ